MARLEVSVTALFFPPPYPSITPESFAQRAEIETEGSLSRNSGATSASDNSPYIQNIITLYNNADIDIHVACQTTHFNSFRITPRQMILAARREAEIQVRLIDPNPQLLAADKSESSSVSSLATQKKASEASSSEDMSSAGGQQSNKVRIPKVMLEWWFSGSETKRSQIILPAYFVAPTPALNKFYHATKGLEVFKALPEVWPPPLPPPPAPMPPAAPPTTTDRSMCLALENKLQILQQSLAHKKSNLAELKKALSEAQQLTKRNVTTTTAAATASSQIIPDEMLEAHYVEVRNLKQHLEALQERLKQVTEEYNKQVKALEASHAKWLHVQTLLTKGDHESQQRVTQIEMQIAVLHAKAQREGSGTCAGCTVT